MMTTDKESGFGTRIPGYLQADIHQILFDLSQIIDALQFVMWVKGAVEQFTVTISQCLFHYGIMKATTHELCHTYSICSFAIGYTF